MSSGWSRALRDLAERLDRAGVEWMLVGSAATAIRGAAIVPGDVDVVTSTPAGVRAAAEVLPSRTVRSFTKDPGAWFSSLAEPILTFGDDARWTFGRWMLAGIKVEVVHIDRPDATDLFIEGCSEPVWRERLVLDWKGTPIPVVPLEVQLATMIDRGQSERLEATLPAVDSVDVGLLRRALADREAAGSLLHVPDAIQSILASQRSNGP